MNDDLIIRQKIVDSGVIVRTETVSGTWGMITGDINNQTDLKDILTGKADLSEVYTKSEADSLFATSDLNLTDFALKTELENYQPKGDYITSQGLAEKDYISKSEASSSYATKSDVSGKVEKVVLESMLSEYQPKGNYLTEIPDTYITEAELEDKHYLTQHQNISGLATKIELNEGLGKKVNITSLDSTLTHYQKKSELTDILTQYPTLSELDKRGYISASDVNENYATKSDISGLASLEYVDSLVGEIDRVLDEINGKEIILG